MRFSGVNSGRKGAEEMTQEEMTARYKVYQNEMTAFIFGEWAVMDIPTREAREAAIEAKHNYRHGWITVDGHSFNWQDAHPNEVFVNVWD